MKTTHIEELVQKVQALPDRQASETALELARAILELHAGALERMMEIIAASEGSAPIREALVGDPRTSNILILHDLHPLDLETRVARALDNPSFRARGATVELTSIEGGVIRVRIDGGPNLRQAVENALLEAAPDAIEVVVTGGLEQVRNDFVPLEALVTG